MALDAVRAGKEVAMVCSGDSGIYGMAGLLYELRGEETEPEISVIPGLTAACSGGAILGAPLTHDFAVISLSDRLTAWETIEKRLEAAAAADLSIVLYNPASRGRPDYLRKAGGPAQRCGPKYWPDGRKRGTADAGTAPGLSGGYVLHGLYRQRADPDCRRAAGHT